eukprot:5691462-Ditylum_brightwellii.AAC.1
MKALIVEGLCDGSIGFGTSKEADKAAFLVLKTPKDSLNSDGKSMKSKMQSLSIFFKKAKDAASGWKGSSHFIPKEFIPFYKKHGGQFKKSI